MTDELEFPAVFLDWDSTFFDKRIGRVLSSNMNEETAARVDAWALENQIDCLYYLADGFEINSTLAAESHDYHLMDLRVTYAITLTQTKYVSSNKVNIRPAVQADLAELKHMAGEFHGISRFFADDHFNKAKCRELYETWIERDFAASDRFLWVSDDRGQISGYTSALINRSEKKAEIGLVGVNPRWRGKGISLQLQLHVLEQLSKQGIEQVEVVTQGRNIKAQNLYQRSGYQLKSIDLWYHKWFTQK